MPVVTKWFVLLVLSGLAAVAQAQELVQLSTRAGVTQSYFLAGLPQNPQAIALLIPGGGGYIRLRMERGQIRFGPNNFVVRSRGEFLKRGVAAAVVDAPSDQQSDLGMSNEFRMSEDHFADISAVVADLKQRFPGLPVFLVATSRGTLSAAALGVRFKQQISGVVLTAAAFRQGGRRGSRHAASLSDFDFASIHAPLLFVHHREDRCVATPYSDAERQSEKYPLVSVSGGLPPQSGDCEALSAHGFLGKESETVEEIVNWMLKRPFRKEVE